MEATAAKPPQVEGTLMWPVATAVRRGFCRPMTALLTRLARSRMYGHSVTVRS
jgi:hypothetical protein